MCARQRPLSLPAQPLLFLTHKRVHPQHWLLQTAPHASLLNRLAASCNLHSFVRLPATLGEHAAAQSYVAAAADKEDTDGGGVPRLRVRPLDGKAPGYQPLAARSVALQLATLPGVCRYFVGGIVAAAESLAVILTEEGVVLTGQAAMTRRARRHRGLGVLVASVTAAAD